MAKRKLTTFVLRQRNGEPYVDECPVLFHRKGLAVTKIDEFEYSVTHLASGTRLAPRDCGDYPDAAMAKRVLLAILPLTDWTRPASHGYDLGFRSGSMRARFLKAIERGEGWR